jgi:hypothetical protein
MQKGVSKAEIGLVQNMVISCMTQSCMTLFVEYANEAEANGKKQESNIFPSQLAVVIFRAYGRLSTSRSRLRVNHW